jgi:hypothetical protein
MTAAQWVHFVFGYGGAALLLVGSGGCVFTDHYGWGAALGIAGGIMLGMAPAWGV